MVYLNTKTKRARTSFKKQRAYTLSIQLRTQSRTLARIENEIKNQPLRVPYLLLFQVG